MESSRLQSTASQGPHRNHSSSNLTKWPGERVITNQSRDINRALKHSSPRTMCHIEWINKDTSNLVSSCEVFFFFLILFLYFRQRGRERKKHQCVVASSTPPTGDLACNPGMCPDWKSNRWTLVHRLALYPLSHTSQGLLWDLRCKVLLSEVFQFPSLVVVSPFVG